MHGHLPSRTYSGGTPAFTLAELLVVLLLIGVMTTSAAVALQGREDPHALRVAADNLVTALRYAQVESDRMQLPHRVVIAEDARSFRVERLATNESDSDFVSVRGLAGQSHVFTDGITLSLNAGVNEQSTGLSVAPDSTDVEAIYFGSGVDAFAGELVLQNQAGDALRVVVMPMTGQVRVVEP